MTCAYETFLVARRIIANVYPSHDKHPGDYPLVSEKDRRHMLDVLASVVRVRSRTSRSITDLLSAKVSAAFAVNYPYKK